MGKSIGVISLKGGVGKTTSVVSLGAALAEFGKKVLLVDGNLSAPNLGLHLNIIDPQSSLHHVLDRISNISDSIVKVGNLDVLPSSLFYGSQVNPLLIKDKLKTVKKDYDVILIDSSPTLDDETLGTILASDELLVVTTPDHVTLSTTIKAIKSAKQRGIPISGLILNKVYNKNFEVPLESIEKTIEVPVLAVIPHDINMIKALSKFEPFTEFKPHSEGSVEFKKLAAVLTGGKYQSNRLKDILRITPTRQEINREIFYERVFK